MPSLWRNFGTRFFDSAVPLRMIGTSITGFETNTTGGQQKSLTLANNLGRSFRDECDYFLLHFWSQLSDGIGRGPKGALIECRVLFKAES